MLLKELEIRVDKLEQTRYACPDGISVDDSMRRARTDVEKKAIYSSTWKWVPPSYYDWPLEKRAEVLQSPSTSQLCKSLLMENRNSDGSDPTNNPKFVLVVIQYQACLDVRKLASAIRSLRPNVKDRLDYNQFDYRVASPEDNDRLTGFSFNSVTPFGLLEKIPIVLTAAVIPLNFLWMGGGHVHLKLGMSVVDFLRVTNSIVADISQPRSGGDEENVY
jgi:prolyl-tRNA editing enzyme YbaK/EbsC (Cys-tRNA(Pro) deacylase)